MSDIELVQSFKTNQNRSSIGVLFQRHINALLSMAITVLKNRTEAEDMVQFTFIAVLDKISDLEHRREESVKSWLMSILINTCKNYLRGEQRRKRRDKIASEQILASSGSNTPAPQDDLFESVLRELDSLPEKYRIPLHLYYQQNMTFPEVANVLSVPTSTIQTRARRGLDKLRAQLAKAGVAASALAITAALKSTPMEAASMALKQELHSLVELGPSSSQKVATLQSPSSTSINSSSLITSSSLKWIVSSLLFIAGVVTTTTLLSSKQTPDLTSIPLSEDTNTPFYLSCQFDTPQLPPELKAYSTPGEELRFKYVENKGRNRSGAIEAQTSVAAFIIDKPIESSPLKVSYWLGEDRSAEGAHSQMFWEKYETYQLAENRERMTFRSSGSLWIKVEVHITKDTMYYYYGNNTKKYFKLACFFKGVKDPKLILIFAKGARIDDLNIEPLREEDLQKLDGFITEFKKIKIPEQIVFGKGHEVPWPKHLKSPFPKRIKPHLVFFKGSLYSGESP